MADSYFEVDRYREFCTKALPDIDALVLDWVASADFDNLLVQTVVSTYPQHEHETFLAHFRGLVSSWVHDQQQACGTTGVHSTLAHSKEPPWP